ncbi:MAG: hypothetical protein ACYC46_01505 [Acidobacteriaceae bacterium]
MLRFRCAVLFLGTMLSAVPLLPAQQAPSSTQTASSTQERHQLDMPRAAELDMSRDFAAGGRLTLDVDVGEVRVVPNPGARAVRLVIQPKHGYLSQDPQSMQDLQNMVERFDVSAGTASIRLKLPHRNHHGSHNGFTVTLYVPADTGLEVSLGVGQLTVSGIRGDKRLDVGVGQLEVNAVDPADYYKMEADCGIGDISDDVFHAKQSGWLGKSEKSMGDGKYLLKAHVGVGEVDFSRKEAAL